MLASRCTGRRDAVSWNLSIKSALPSNFDFRTFPSSESREILSTYVDRLIEGLNGIDREWLSWAALIGGIALTILLWIVAYTIGGGR